MAQPYYQDATAATKAGMQNVGPLTAAQIQQYQNPFTQAVVDPTVRALQQQQGQQLSEQQGQAIRSGAFGGDRSGLARATLQGQQGLALGQAIAPIYERGYNTAVQTAMGQQGVVAADLARQLAGGQQLGNLGSAAQNAALTGAQAQIAAGTLPQQTKQAEDTAKYQQYLQEKGYPFQTTQFLAGIAEGTGALSGNTTTQTQGGGFFSSDARLKENIEPIGELFDGQTVYRYNYKDDKHKKTQIGLIAQEAAKEKKPGVGVDDDGFLAVNYHDVTDEAAEAGKGLVPSSMGGAVREAGAFARGGYATQGGVDFGSLVAAQAEMYKANKQKEAGLGIPSESKTPKSLQVQPMLKPDKQPNAMEQAMKMGQGVAQTGEAVKKISNWKPIEGFKETFGIGNKANTTAVGKNTDRIPGGENPNAKGLPGAPSPAAASTKTTGLAPAGDKLQTAEFKGPGLGQYGDSFGRSPAPTGVAPQYASATMNDAGPQPFMPDANNNVDVAYSGRAYEIPPAAAKPRLQDIQAQNAVFEGADAGSDLETSDTNSFGGMGGNDMGFSSSLDSLGDFASFFNRGGRTNPYASGGLVPRQHYAGAGFVTPGYDTEHNPTDIMDQILDEQEGEAKDDASQFNSMKPKMGGSGGGGGGGFNPMSAIGPAISLMGMFSDARLKKNIEPVGKTYDGQNIYRYDFGDGNTQLGLIAQEVAKHKPESVGKKDGYLTVDYKRATKDATPFAYGGLVPREHHDGTDGNVVGPSDQDLDYMARTMIREAGGEGPEGMAAVGHVMRNRLNSGNFGKTMENVATAPKQFTPWNEDLRGTYQDPRLINPESEDYKNARELARKVHLGEIEDPTKGALNFYNPKKASPSWGETMGNRVTIGNHDFGTAGGEPRPPKDVGPTREDATPKPGLGSFLSGKSGKGKFGGVEAKNASLGDVVREYAPSGMPTSENAWLPALGFLGGMLSSPNPKFLGALGSGLVSGVSTQFELDKLNEDRVKNAFNLLKDRFVDSMQVDANGMPYLMKLDKDTGKLYTPDQLTSVRANLLNSMGVNANAYGLGAGPSQQPVRGDRAAGPSAPAAPAAPAKPGETKVAEGEAGAAGAATTPKKAADPLKAAAAAMYPLPPEGLDQTEMSKAHLKSAAFWNPKEYSVAEDPMAIVANIQNLKARVKAWDALGDPAAAETANKFRGQIDSETKRLDTILGEAVDHMAKRNEGIQAATIAKADKFGDEIKQRTEKYRTIRSQLLRLADLQAEGLNTGKGAEAVRDMVSFAQTISGGAIEMPFLSSLTNAGQFDHAAKIAAAQIVNGVKEAGLQRAPAAGLKTEAKITPSTEMSPGGIHQLLGQMLGEMDYVHERDQAYLQGKNRWSDPSKFMEKYDTEGGPKGGDYKYNKKVAEAFSQLPIPEKGGKDIPEIIDSLRKKYGEKAEIDYGYRPKTQKEVAPAAAPAISPAERAGALEWLSRPENANDPRAKQIRQRLGIQ
jgi:hypothetical protein